LLGRLDRRDLNTIWCACDRAAETLTQGTSKRKFSSLVSSRPMSTCLLAVPLAPLQLCLTQHPIAYLIPQKFSAGAHASCGVCVLPSDSLTKPYHREAYETFTCTSSYRCRPVEFDWLSASRIPFVWLDL